MKQAKLLLSLALSLCLIIISTLSASAVSLECNVTIDATCESDKPTILITNNSDKTIYTFSYGLIQYGANGPIDDTEMSLFTTKIEVGETKTFNPSIFVQEPIYSIRIYPISATFEDYSTWSSGVSNYQEAQEKGLVIEIANTTSAKQSTNYNSKSSSDFGIIEVITSLLSIFIIVGFIVGYSKYKDKKYKETDYYKETGIPYRTVKHNAGMYGEYLSREYLNSIDGYKLFLSNCYLPKEDNKTTEVDLIMLHTSGIYVIESKNFGGRIYGNEESKQWMQIIGNNTRNQFYNPVMQNAHHITVLKHLLHFENLPIYSVIVFSDRCNINKVEVRAVPVIHRNNLLSTIKSLSNRTPDALTEAKINEIYNHLHPYTQVSEEVKQKHIDDIHASH